MANEFPPLDTGLVHGFEALEVLETVRFMDDGFKVVRGAFEALRGLQRVHTSLFHGETIIVFNSAFIEDEEAVTDIEMPNLPCFYDGHTIGLKFGDISENMYTIFLSTLANHGSMGGLAGAGETNENPDARRKRPEENSTANEKENKNDENEKKENHR